MIINLNPKQLEITEMAVTAFIDLMALYLRESTYSEIVKNRWKIALEVQEVLKEARYK